MYAVTSILLESLTRATFRSAEFGFFGVMVLTRVTTPLFWGDAASEYLRSFELNNRFNAVDRVFLILFALPLFANCASVGIGLYYSINEYKEARFSIKYQI